MTACELCPPEARATTAMMIAGIDLTLGVEEEYQIINPYTRELDSYVRQFLEDGGQFTPYCVIFQRGELKCLIHPD